MSELHVQTGCSYDLESSCFDTEDSIEYADADSEAGIVRTQLTRRPNEEENFDDKCRSVDMQINVSAEWQFDGKIRVAIIILVYFFFYYFCLFVLLFGFYFVLLVALASCVHRNHGAISGKRRFHHPAFSLDLFGRFDDFILFPVSHLQKVIYIYLHDLHIWAVKSLFDPHICCY